MTRAKDVIGFAPLGDTQIDRYVAGTDLLYAAPTSDEEDFADTVLSEVADADAEEGGEPLLASEVDGATDEAWTLFVRAMAVAPSDSTDDGIGLFAIKPRRLGDLGLMADLKKVKSSTGKMVWEGAWTKVKREDFLANTFAQYRVFSISMARYTDDLKSGRVQLPKGGMPMDLSLSGALAVLHRCGPNGLKNWGEGERFSNTKALLRVVNGIF